MTDSSKERDELIRRFEDAAHEIHGDATEYLAKRDHDGLVEYVRGDVNSSWVFFKAGSEDARQQTAKEIAQKLRMYARNSIGQNTVALAYEAAANEIEREYEVQP